MGNIGNVMEEFKKFILRGNIIDMAVGVIIGGAFSKIVTSLVNDILMPILGAIIGQTSFTNFKFIIHPASEGVEEAAILYGSFLQNIFDFLIIGLCMFFMLKAVAMVSAKFHHEENTAEAEAAVTGPTTEELLGEIRDLLKEKEQTAS